MQRRIIFVLEYPLSHRDTVRFGYERLEAQGFSVQTWDLSALWLPGSSQVRVPDAHSRYVRAINSSRELRRLCEELEPQDTIVQVGGASPYVVWQRRKELVYLARSKARWTLLHVGALPLGDDRLKECIRQETTRLTRVRMRAADLRRRVTNRLMGAYLSFARSAWNQGLRPFDHIWAGTTLQGVAPFLVSAQTRSFFIHSLDYDTIIDLAPSVQDSCDYIVFLDSMGPLHPDYKVLDIDPGQTMADFATLIGSGLDFLENEFQLRMVIAGHPRSESDQLKDLYGDREIVRGQTAERIRDSAMVACAEGSTALGIAVALGKPILLLTSETSPSLVRQLNAALICALDPFHFDLDAGSVKNPHLGPDQSKYRTYMERYVKRSGSPERNFWDVVAERLGETGSK